MNTSIKFPLLLIIMLAFNFCNAHSFLQPIKGFSLNTAYSSGQLISQLKTGDTLTISYSSYDCHHRGHKTITVTRLKKRLKWELFSDYSYFDLAKRIKVSKKSRMRKNHLEAFHDFEQKAHAYQAPSFNEEEKFPRSRSRGYIRTTLNKKAIAFKSEDIYILARALDKKK